MANHILCNTRKGELQYLIIVNAMRCAEKSNSLSPYSPKLQKKIMYSHTDLWETLK